MSHEDYTESEHEVSQPIAIPQKKPRKQITEKQRQARIKNLAMGREKRLANVQAKKKPIQEYDIDSEEESSGDDDDEFVLSKKKKVGKVKPIPQPAPAHDLKGELQELRGMMFALAKQQKKQKVRQPSNKIVVIPQGQTSAPQASSEYSNSLSQLLSAINRK